MDIVGLGRLTAGDSLMSEVRRQLWTHGDRRCEETLGGPNAEHSIAAMQLVKPRWDIDKRDWNRNRTWGVEREAISRKPKYLNLRETTASGTFLGAKNKSRFHIPHLPRGSLVRPQLSVE